jgi:hypothetical protein
MGQPLFLSLSALIISLWISIPGYAQQSRRPAIINEITTQRPGEGKVEITQDRKIDDLMRKYIEFNAQKSTITGFSICIYSGSKQAIAKTKATETRTKFITNFPGIDAAMRYERPDWRVFVGNFRNRTDAFRLKKQIETMFPNAYIVETQIELSKL